jgi:hypothetical protein
MARRPTGRAARRLSPAGYRALLDDGEKSTRIEDGLTVERPDGKRPAVRRTAEQIRAEARARHESFKRSDPGWVKFERRNAQQLERGGLSAADLAELHAKRMDEAFESENEALIIARGKEFVQASPSGWTAYLGVLDEAVLQDYADAGIDPDDDDHIAEPDMPSVVYGNAVRDANEHERLSRELAQKEAEFEGIVNRNGASYVRQLEAGGIVVDPDDEASVESYQALKNYIKVGTGIDVGALSYESPDEAASWMLKAKGQIDAWESQLRQHAFKEDLLATETANVSDGLSTGEDETARLLREQNDLLRIQAGLGPEGEPEAPMFDPDWEPEVPRSDEPQSVEEWKAEVEEFKQSLSDDTISLDGGPEVKSGYTDDSGTPISEDDAMGGPERREAAERDRAYERGLVYP